MPMSLALVMFGMGLSLVKTDFARLFEMPAVIAVGLLGQIIVLPLLAFLIAVSLKLSPPLAIGLMILAGCPGGTSSNIISHIARANLALSVSLTALSSVICVFTTPFVIAWSIQYFSSQITQEISLFGTAIGLIVITLIPLFIGLIVRHKFTVLALKYEIFFRRFSVFFMSAMIVGVMIQEKDLIVSAYSQMTLAALLLSLSAVAIGLLLGKTCRFNDRDSLTLSIEVGLQNASMAILIAVNLIEIPAYATSAAVYGLIMYIVALIPIFLARRIA